MPASEIMIRNSSRGNNINADMMVDDEIAPVEYYSPNNRHSKKQQQQLAYGD